MRNHKENWDALAAEKSDQPRMTTSSVPDAAKINELLRGITPAKRRQLLDFVRQVMDYIVLAAKHIPRRTTQLP